MVEVTEVMQEAI